MIERLLHDLELWKLISIPFVAAVVGWATNWVAIELTFRPLEFLGLRPWLGWQGIIPSKATKMANTFVDSTMHRLGTVQELFAHMEPARIAEHITEMMDRRLAAYTDEIMFYNHSALWRTLPDLLKKRIVEGVRSEMPRLVDNLMAEIGENIENLLDFKDMIVRHLTGDKALLNRLFLESGKAEFVFIVRSGFYFGFLFGLVQLAVWIVYPVWWVLPFFGLVVGYATNWLALNVIFRPLRPVRLGPWTLQGLFLKRQPEVARVWCRIVTREMLTVRHIVQALMNGPRSDRVKTLVRKHIEPVAEAGLGLALPMAQLTVGPRALEEIRNSIGEKAVAVSTEPFDHWPFNEERGKVIEDLLRERMESLPSEEFQDLLRPCFQEDEWKLVVMGGVLGLFAGLAQLVFVFGGF